MMTVIILMGMLHTPFPSFHGMFTCRILSDESDAVYTQDDKGGMNLPVFLRDLLLSGPYRVRPATLDIGEDGPDLLVR